MSRIRTIKPEFWTDAAIVECSTNARLLFVGMWNFADDYGNLDRSAKQIKGQVFPCDDLDCEPLIVSLIVRGLLVEYSSNDKKYLHIQNFVKHQRIDRPGPPRCPDFDESLIIPRIVVEDSTNCRGSFHPVREGKGEVEVKENTKTRRKKPDLRPLPAGWKPSDRTSQRLSQQYRFQNGDIERYLEAFHDACAAKGYQYADFDAAFCNCVRQDWPKLRANGAVMPRKKTAAELLDEAEAVMGKPPMEMAH